MPASWPASWFETEEHDWRVVTVDMSYRASALSVLEEKCRRCPATRIRHSSHSQDFWNIIKKEQPEDTRR